MPHRDPESTKIHVDLHVHMEGFDDRFNHHEQLLRRLFTLGENIMAGIKEFSAAQKAAFERMNASFAGLTGDSAALLAKIEQLQNTSGAITPEDQALLDEAQAMAEGIASALEALDASNPDVVTPV